MSYDQYVLPAEHSTSPEAAQRHLSAQAGAAPTPAAAEVATRIGERCGEHLSLTPLTAEGDTVAVPVGFRGVEDARVAVHEEALAAGFGVYDPQVGVVIDPREVLPGTLITQDGELPTLTRPAVAQLVGPLAVERFVVVTTADPQVYAQTYRNSADDWTVERREGGPDAHFATRATTAAQVHELLDAWLRGDTDTVTAVGWERLTL
ncbi:hypothetical protein RDV89_02810 [Nocardioides zeae]|uniref:ESAT-6 protein secretion system EspG family protein n=1 Tax=Nocardioides imazamoxiresistens TaxID=3231893 RepID=A0ABU3PRX1_9ACTN|nr:hypothetical protein [Nocardioides zeae]MDT9591980.1 hypothetical protein [Nocardioides zeae]